MLKNTVLFLLLPCFIQTVHGEAHLLAIAIDAYESPSFPALPGIDKDLANIKQIGKHLGIPTYNTKVLQGKVATYNRILDELTNLAQRANPGDFVLIYFSGHGVQFDDLSGDETDRKDEGFPASDLAVRNGIFYNIISDDLMAKMLKKFRTKNLLTIWDHCHSGTMSKSLSLIQKPLGPNKFTRKSMYLGDKVRAFQSFDEEQNIDYISISACEDEEETFASWEGSLLTRGLLQALQKAIKANQKLSFEALVAQATSYIAEYPLYKHNPQLNGDQQRFAHEVYPNPFHESSNQMGSFSQKSDHWEQIVQSASTNISAWPNQREYTIGDLLTFNMNIPFDGHLNIIDIDSNGEETLLFPNDLHRENHVKAGFLKFPNESMGFDLEAQYPAGESRIIVLLTKQQLNLHTNRKSLRALARQSNDGMVSKGFSPRGHGSYAANEIVIPILNK